MSAYSRLRVEEGPPKPDALTNRQYESFESVEQRAPKRVDKPNYDWKADALYWKFEAGRVIQQRGELLAALRADSPAAYFRQQFGRASDELEGARRKIARLERELKDARTAAANFDAAREQLDVSLAGLKRSLWDIWSALEESNPLRRALWTLWSTLN